MIARVRPHRFSGRVRIPASKSHTIRQLLIASLAGGVSEIQYPLDSLDTRSCAATCRVLGADVQEQRSDGHSTTGYTVRGNGGILPGGSLPNGNLRVIDVGNSGTTLYLALAAAALGNAPFEFTGDAQIEKRSAAPLLAALSDLGIRAESLRSNGCTPIIIQGPWKGGKTSLPCPTSQFLSAVLLAAPLAPSGVTTEIEVPLLNERPYIEMTLSYLSAQGIPYTTDPDFSRFIIPGGSAWKPFTRSVPGDFSSAAFPVCAAVVSGGSLTVLGLDPDDTQGDKVFLDIIAQMGCAVEWKREGAEWALAVSAGGILRGGTFDLNASPDLLPAVAICAAFAAGDTALVNVAHARIKETDRVAVMAAELAQLGVRCTERADGLVIHGQGGISGGAVNGCGDHRIVMAFAAAATGASAPIEIDTAESAAVTYPSFLELLEAEMRE